MPRYRLVSAIALGLLGAAVACDSFGGEGGPGAVTPEGGALDEAGHPIDGDIVVDGGRPDAPPEPPGDLLDASVRPPPSGVQTDGLYLTCPPTSTLSKFHSTSSHRIVEAGTGYDYPFGIVTDALNVYWVSQYTANVADVDGPYNGHGKARIHRAPKTGTDISLSDTVIVDGEAAETVSIALDGEYIYWAAVKTPTTAEIRRVPRNCAAPCSPDVLLETAASRPISKMRRGQPGLIFAMTDQGQVLAIDTANKKVRSGVQPNHSNPSLATLTDSAFVSWLAEPKVLRATADGVVDHAELPAPDGGTDFGGHVTTDCTRLFAWRKTDGDLWYADARQPSLFDRFASVRQVSVYDAFADNDYVYLASANGYGIAVIDIAKRELIQKLSGAFFRIWADDKGLYAGDHARSAPGSIYRFGD